MLTMRDAMGEYECGPYAWKRDRLGRMITRRRILTDEPLGALHVRERSDGSHYGFRQRPGEPSTGFIDIGPRELAELGQATTTSSVSPL